jgi:hypothetical protein
MPFDPLHPYRVAIFHTDLTDELIAQFNEDNSEADLDYEVGARWEESTDKWTDFSYPTWRAARSDFFRLASEFWGCDLSTLRVLKKTPTGLTIVTTLPKEEEDDSNTETNRKKEMVNISFFKKDGHTFMKVDARELQIILDGLGAVARDGRYMDRPVVNHQVVDPTTHKLSSEVFLVKPGANGALPEFDLTATYNRPISKANLETLGESAEGVVRMILDHYQPVDITVDLRKKVVA